MREFEEFEAETMDENWEEEPSLPQSEFVLILARSVGFLVAIVAVVLAILLMMTIRALIAFLLTKVGITLLSAFVAIVVAGISLYGQAKISSIWIILSRSCI